MFIDAKVPGAENLPPYSNTPAFHQAVAKIFPNSYATNYFLSWQYDYTRRPENGGGTEARDGSVGGRRGRSLTEFAEPASTWIMTEYSANPVSGLGGWYCYPGYLNDQTAGNHMRWRGGMRHSEGRHFLFVDGHSKWYKDPAFVTSTGAAVPPGTILASYTNNKLYTTPK